MPNEIYHRSEWGNPNPEGWGDIYFDPAATNKLYNHSDYYENSDGTDKILRDIPNKASITLTPTAYSDGSINTVIPPYQVLPQELVTNGTFDTDSDWTKGSGWTIADGKATVTNSTVDSIYQDFLDTSKIYKATFEITEITSGSLRIGIGINFSDYFTEAGTYTYYGKPTNDGLLRINPSSGTNASLDNVSVKEVQEADFDFSRGSSATRVNEKGLIEDVQILSGELVQNGDFEEIGSELVTNGNFATDSDWSKSGSVEISNGSANFDIVDGLFTRISQTISLTNGKTYKLTLQVLGDNSAKQIYVRDTATGDNGGLQEIITLAEGTTNYTFYFTANANSNAIYIKRQSSSGDYQFSIDNVSVKEVGQNWTFGTGWSMGDGKAVFNTTSNASLLTNLSISSGNLYRLKIEGEVTSGNIKLSASSGLGDDQVISLPFEQDITHDGGGNTVEIRTVGSAEGFISNVSVIKVTNDTDIPRIDYTTGFGSWLLEPQRTNLITYSEDFSEWSKGTGGTGSVPVVISNNAISPDGNNTADKVVLDMNGGTTSSDFSFITIGYTSSATTFTLSCYLKGVNGREEIFFDFDNGNSNLITLTTEWVRYDFTKTVSATGTRLIRIGLRGGSTTDDTASFYAWGAQLEVGSYPTSYIVSNSGSTTTRSAETANNSGNADLFNDSEGVLYAEIAALADDGTVRNMAISNGTNNERVLLQYYTSSNVIRAFCASSGSSLNMPHTLTNATDFVKVCFKYKSGDYALWVNGVEVDTKTDTFTPTGLNKLAFDNGSGGGQFYGKTKELAVFKEALTDAELESLTSWISFTEMATDLEYTVE